MEKEALIDIILNDIKEIHALVKTFKGKNEINTAFVNLTRTKIANINEELSLLEQLNDQKTELSKSESSLTSAVTSHSDNIDNEAIAESSKAFISGEASTIIKNNDTKTGSPAPTLTKEKEEVQSTPAAASLVSVAKEQEKIEDTKPIVEAKIITERKEEVDKKKATPPSKPTVLGESIKQESNSVNELNAKENSSHIKQLGKPVNDVRKAIGLNDRFYFQRELFSNNADLFNQTLDQINAMNSLSTATSFLQSNFDWNTDDEVTQSFFNSIQRRFL